MAQTRKQKNRSYRLGGGKALDAYNERLAMHDDDGLSFMHATKGMRVFSAARLEAQMKIEPAMHDWARRAARIAGSRIGGEKRERGLPPYRPHQGARECARRCRQKGIAA